MKATFQWCVAGWVGVMAVAVSPLSAGSPLSNDPSSLAVCQDSIRVAAVRLAAETRRGLGACLTRGIECVADPAADAIACCTRAAERCSNDFAKVERARRRFRTQVVHRRCSVIPFDEVLSALGYEGLAPRCAALDPVEPIDTLASLTACLDRLIVGATACPIGTIELPRAAEGLACLGLEETFRAVGEADLTRCGAPVAPSPSASTDATPTPVVEPTPTSVPPTGTATPIATSSSTTSPSAPTASPSPSATPTLALATATPTATPAATSTAVVATATATALPPTITATRTATPIPTVTASAIVATATPIATATPLLTSTRTATPIATTTPTRTTTPVATTTATRTATPVPTTTATRTTTPIPTSTTTPVPTTTATRTATPVATATATRTATPVPTATATPSGPVCGNGTKESGEDCDDGNTFDCDECPASCKTAPPDCTATTTRAPQTVRLRAPEGQSITSGLFCLRYPAGTVGLPGTGLVTQRTSGFQGTSSVNDFNNAVRIGLLGRNAVSEVSVTLSFDLCTNATAPPPTAFSCRVVSASNAGATLPPELVECTPLAPNP